MSFLINKKKIFKKMCLLISFLKKISLRMMEPRDAENLCNAWSAQYSWNWLFHKMISWTMVIPLNWFNNHIYPIIFFWFFIYLYVYFVSCILFFIVVIINGIMNFEMVVLNNFNIIWSYLAAANKDPNLIIVTL